MARLLHLNGPPGIGTSTLARRYVDAHPGVLCADIDVLRTLVGGWRDDFAGVGAVIRPSAQALIGAHLAGGRDVVMPQMIANDAELDAFEAVAADAGATYVHVLLTDDGDAVVDRFERCGGADPDPWHVQVREIVARQGGAAVVRGCHDRLTGIARRRPDVTVVRTVAGGEDAAYDAVLAAFDGHGTGAS